MSTGSSFVFVHCSGEHLIVSKPDGSHLALKMCIPNTRVHGFSCTRRENLSTYYCWRPFFWGLYLFCQNLVSWSQWKDGSYTSAHTYPNPQQKEVVITTHICLFHIAMGDMHTSLASFLFLHCPLFYCVLSEGFFLPKLAQIGRAHV